MIENIAFRIRGVRQVIGIYFSFICKMIVNRCNIAIINLSFQYDPYP